MYVCLACPWAHRALIVRQLKGLEDYICEYLRVAMLIVD